MRPPAFLLFAFAVVLAGCGSPSAPLAASGGAQSTAGMSAYAPGSANVTATQVPAPPPGVVVAANGTGGVQELSAPVPNGANNPATAAQGVCVNQIQSQLQSLVSLAQVGMPMSGGEALSQSQNLIHFFSRTCYIVPWPGASPISGSDLLGGEMSQWLGGMQIGTFKIKQQYVKVSPDRTRGRAVLCLKVDVTYLNRVVRYEGWYSTDWAPSPKGTWVIQGVTPIDVASASTYGDTIPQVYFAPYWGPDWGDY